MAGMTGSGTAAEKWLLPAAPLECSEPPTSQAREPSVQGPRRRARVLLVVGLIADVVLIGGLAWLLGHSAGAFSGFPKGFDAWGHFSKIHLLIVNFPQVEWNDAWYSGLPYFQGSYPPLYHALTGLAVYLSGASIPSAMVAVAAVSVIVTAVCFYGFVRVLTSSRPAGIVGALLLLGTPAYWALILNDGMYPRLIGIACLSLALLGAALHMRRSSRWWLVLSIVGIVGALSSHPVVGVPGALLVAALLALGPASSPAAAYDRTRAFLVAVGALAAYFYVPLLVTYRGQQTFLHYPPLVLQTLFWPTRATDIHALSPVLLPAGLTIASALIVLARRGSLKAAAGGPAIVGGVCAAIAAAWLAYGRMGAWGLDSVNGLMPKDTLVFIGLLLAAACAAGLAALLKTVTGRARRRAVVGSALLAAGLSVGVTAQMLPKSTRNLDDAGTRSMIATFPSEAANQHEYRFAAPVDYASNWINSLYDTPQVRGYQSQAVPNLDWQVWLEDALKEPNWPAPERRFLLDWYGVKWIYAGPGNADSAPYAQDPRLFTPLASTSVGPSFRVYRYEAPGAILTARSTRTVLVIGDSAHYDSMLRSIATVDENSQRTILIDGGSFIDAYSPHDLAQFDAVVLYGGSAHDPARAAHLLNSYVRGGGGLFVDSADNRQFVDELARRGAPIPVTQTLPYQVAHAWGLGPQPTHVVQGISFGGFSPPVYGRRSPWQVATGIRLQPWARWDLAAGPQMVMASGRYGAGQALWSGMNLPFHVAVYRNPVESGFLVRILDAVARTRQVAAPQYNARFINAQRLEVTVTAGASGVLLKETASAQWHATVNGKEARIYTAGPGMMYVPISSARRPASVVFQYRASMVETLGWAITGAALLALVCFGLGVRFSLPALAHRVRRRAAPRSS